MKEESSLPADDTEHLKMILRPFVLQAFIVGLAWQPTLVFLTGESPWTEEPGGLQFVGLQRVGHI